MNRDTLRQLAVAASLVVTLVMNGLANALPLNGRTTGDISDSFPNFFVPAGYVFAIWGVIYLSLIGFTVYQALPAQRTNQRLRQIGWWVVGSNLANALWIVWWHFGQYALSLATMIALLVILVVIYTRFDPDRRNARGALRWLAMTPFSLYLGWITVAVIPNTSVVLLNWGWDGFGISGEVWAIALLVVASVVGTFVALPRRDWVYAGVLVWAFIGINARFATLPLLSTSANIAAAAVAVVLVWSFVRALNARFSDRNTPSVS